MEPVNVGISEGELVRMSLVPTLAPLKLPAVVELGRGYGVDTVGLDDIAVSVLLELDTVSVPLEPNEIAVERGRPEELVSVKGAGLKDKG